MSSPPLFPKDYVSRCLALARRLSRDSRSNTRGSKAEDFGAGMSTKKWTLAMRLLMVRLLLQYIVPIIALFHGRVIDKPEQAMTETIYSTGGEVGHEVCP